MTTLSLLADRPVNWNVLGVSAADPDGTAPPAGRLRRGRRRGATVVALTLPHTMRIRLSFEPGAILDGLPGWREVLALPKAERMVALSDPEVRRRLDGGRPVRGGRHPAATWPSGSAWSSRRPSPRATPAYEGRTVGEVAAERGQSPFDAMLDVVVADELRTGLRPAHPRDRGGLGGPGRRLARPADRRRGLGRRRPPRHHVRCGVLDLAARPTGCAGGRCSAGRRPSASSPTCRPASTGCADRGRLAEGWWADVVVFDPAEVGHGPERTRYDLPGGASRLYAEATGVEHVLVNGTEVVRHDALTGERPGRVLRSGRDTDTVPASGPGPDGPQGSGAPRPSE